MYDVGVMTYFVIWFRRLGDDLRREGVTQGVLLGISIWARKEGDGSSLVRRPVAMQF